MTSHVGEMPTSSQEKKLAIWRFLIYGAFVMCWRMERIRQFSPPRHYLKEWREKLNLTQQQLADRLETGKDQVSRYENNNRKMTLEMAGAFAEAMGLDNLALFRHPDAPSVDELLRNASPEQRRQAFAVIEAILKAS
jgi:DNA-binding XRE family transcriptional regulator